MWYGPGSFSNTAISKTGHSFFNSTDLTHKVYDYEIINEYPHDHTSFTQGMEISFGVRIKRSFEGFEFRKECSENEEVCRDAFLESTGINHSQLDL